MKIAGRKNDGAWFRANKFLKSIRDHRPTVQADITASITANCPSLSNAYNDMLSIATETGVVPPMSPSNFAAWADRMTSIGIPRQVWFGKWTFTTYTKVGTKYKPNYQDNIRTFAKELRKCITKFIYATRQVNDVFDNGTALEQNPGGQPDALKNN